MAHYIYEGTHFELPDGLSNEDAISKIETHLGKTPKESSSSLGDYASKVGKSVAGVAEAGLNLAGGVGGMIVAPVVAGLGAINNMTQGKPADFETQYATTMGQASQLGTSLADVTGLRSSAGDSLNAGIGEFMNQVGIPAAGVAHSIPARIPSPAEFGKADNIPIPTNRGTALDSLIAEQKPIEQPAAKVGSINDVPQATKDQQAVYNRMRDEPLPEQQPVPDTKTAQLPFDAPPEEMVRERYIQDFTNPDDVPMQRDMFAEQDLSARDNDPYAQKQQTQAEIEQAYAQRQAEHDAAVAQENQRRAEQDTQNKIARAQELRDQQLAPLQEQLSQERVSKGQQRKAQSRQRGAIDVEAVKETIQMMRDGFMNQHDILNSFKGAFSPLEMSKMREALSDPKSSDTVVLMSPDDFHAMAAPRGAAWMAMDEFAPGGPKEKQFNVRIGLKSKNGLMELPYLMVDKNGKVTGHEGRHRMDVFKEQGIDMVPVRIRGDIRWGLDKPPTTMTAERKGTTTLPFPQPLTQRAVRFPENQRGALSFGKGKEIATKTADAPDVVEAAKALSNAQTARTLLGTDEGFRGNMDTPEKVLAAVSTNPTKDISPLQLSRAKTITGGSNRLAGQTNHPLVKFVRDSVRKSLRDSEQTMRTFVTNKDGLGPMWNKLSQSERNEVMGAWHKGDQAQMTITREMMDKVGFSERQIQTLEHIYKMQDFLYDRTNAAYEHAGLDKMHKREGHMPGIFSGDYRSLVMSRDGVDKAGKPVWKPVQYFSASTEIQHALIKGKVEELFQGPGFKIEPIERRSMSNKTGLTGEMGVLMDLLGRNDEAFAKVQDTLKQISAESAAKLYGASLHAKEKIGIGGNEGNKFWKSVDENTNEGMKAYLQYYEDMIASHNLLKTEVDLNGLMNNPVLDGMPNAKNYVMDYMRNTQGRSLGDVGQALNTLMDAPFKYVLHVGPSFTKTVIHQVAKRMGQKAMGMFNLPFTAMQFLQIAQTALPEAIGLAKNLKQNPVEFASALKQGAVDAFALTHESISGEKNIDPFRREMFDFAEANGLLNFSEFADVNKVTQSKTGQMFDSVVDFNRVLGEAGTRPIVFFAFARMLEKAGFPKEEILNTAYNKTQYAMVDYTPPEIPMMYSKLGQVGKMAGTLKTFNHSFMGQQMDWVGRATKGDWTPLATGAAMSALFSGITGAAGYQEADQLFQWMTNKFFDKRQTIREAVLGNLSGWMQNGIVSDATNINVQSRLGQADLLPNSFMDAISPYASTIGDMTTTAVDLVKDPNAITARNAAKAFAPSSVRGVIENTLGKAENGNTLDKEGQKDYPRTPFDWKLRNFGLTSMSESKDKETLYNQSLARLSDQEAQKQLMTYILRGFRTDKQYGVSKEFAEMRKKYLDRGGNPETLVNDISSRLQSGEKTKKQRLEGIPSSLGTIHNYEYFNK